MRRIIRSLSSRCHLFFFSLRFISFSLSLASFFTSMNFVVPLLSDSCTLRFYGWSIQLDIIHDSMYSMYYAGVYRYQKQQHDSNSSTCRLIDGQLGDVMSFESPISGKVRDCWKVHVHNVQLLTEGWNHKSITAVDLNWRWWQDIHHSIDRHWEVFILYFLSIFYICRNNVAECHWEFIEIVKIVLNSCCSFVLI